MPQWIWALGILLVVASNVAPISPSDNGWRYFQPLTKPGGSTATVQDCTPAPGQPAQDGFSGWVAGRPPEAPIPARKPAEPGRWQLAYTVRFEEGSPYAEVTVHLKDPENQIGGLHLPSPSQALQPAPFDLVSNVRVTAGQVNGARWDVRNVTDASLTYRISLAPPSGYGGDLFRAEKDWILTPGQYLFPTGYDGWGGMPGMPERIELTVVQPPGWRVYTPYGESAGNRFDVTGRTRWMAPQETLLLVREGIVQPDVRRVGGTTLTTVSVPGAVKDAARVGELLARSAAVFDQVAGWSPEGILAVVVPSTKQGSYVGEANGSSLIIGDNSPFPFGRGNALWTHELAHVYQYFLASQDGGPDWVKEGLATYYQYYGLLRARYLTPEQFWHCLTTEELSQTRPGQGLKDDPYHRGALVILAMDILIRQDSGGRCSLDDLLRYSNAASEAKPLTVADLAETMTMLTGRTYDDFFKDSVLGTILPEAILKRAGPDLYYME